MELITTEELKQKLKIKDTRTIKKFINEGLKVIKISSRDYRFDLKDVETFLEGKKEIAETEIQFSKRKAKSKKINIDFQKRKFNLENLKVI